MKYDLFVCYSHTEEEAERSHHLFQVIQQGCDETRTTPCFCFCFGFLFFILLLFIYFWLRWVFVAERGLSLVAASRGYSSLWCTGFSLVASLVAEHGL